MVTIYLTGTNCQREYGTKASVGTPMTSRIAYLFTYGLFSSAKEKQVFYFVQKGPYVQRTNIPLIRLVHTLSNTRFRCYTVGMKNSLQCLLIFPTQYKIVLCTKHIFQPKQNHQNILDIH